MASTATANGTSPPPADNLIASSSALQAAAGQSNEALRETLLSVTTGRDAVLAFSRELVQIQTACRLLSRHAAVLASETTTLPDTIVVALVAVVSQTVQLVGVAMQVVDQMSTSRNDEEHVTTLRNMSALVETAKTAIEVGVDAMSL